MKQAAEITINQTRPMNKYDLHIMLNVELTRRKQMHFAINSEGETVYSSTKACDIFAYAKSIEAKAILLWIEEGSPSELELGGEIDCDQMDMFGSPFSKDERISPSREHEANL